MSSSVAVPLRTSTPTIVDDHLRHLQEIWTKSYLELAPANPAYATNGRHAVLRAAPRLRTQTPP
eukprot:scaffold22630_cov29-Tisochrysis_lutea.AAC.2